ncbi:MAG: hypothetical protein HQ495_14130, partial [Alphaproteobacteria bacterium]|nr:hypothetical protein [Alphaproteobacteria bacterium]
MGRPFHRQLVLCAWVVAGLWSSTGQAQTAAEIFLRAFGAPPPTAETLLPVPLIVEGQYRSDIDFAIGADPDRERVSGAPLIEALSRVLTDDAIRALRDATQPDGMILVTDIRGAGIEAAFDPTRVEFAVNLPIAVRRTQSSALRSSQAPAAAAFAIGPARLSGFTNVRTAMSHIQRADVGNEDGRQPARIDLDGAVNWNRTVFEWLVSYQESAPRPWQRGSINMSRDDIDRRLRFSAGDLTYPVANLQSFVPMG